jgi:hypothetical protein
MTFAIWALIIGALLITMALSGTSLSRLPLSTALLYLAAGYGLGPAGWALLAPDPLTWSVALERVSEVAVLISLFAVGLKLGLPLSDRGWRLPVRLALALLADRNGVIDVNLPISGSINEPQFSLMGLVFKMIGNLLVKVVTAPFAWLAGSGTQDLSAIGFDPGAARLEAPAVQALDQLFRALSDRPALRMTITGAADLGSESGALRSAGLQERLMALLRREAARAGPSGASGLSGPSGTSGTSASSGSFPGR